MNKNYLHDLFISEVKGSLDGGVDEYVVVLNKTFEAAKAAEEEWGGESHMWGNHHFWTTDIDGNDLCVDGISVLVHIPGQSELSSGELNVRVGKGKPTNVNSWTTEQAQPYIGYPGAAPNNGDERWYSYEYDLRKGRLTSTKATNERPTDNFTSNYMSECPAFSKCIAKNEWQYLSGVELRLISGSFPAGTELFIYARKYNPKKVDALPKWEVTE